MNWPTFADRTQGYASDWQRRGYDLAWGWAIVKGALKERRALWQVDVEVHRHYARMQAAKDAKDRAAGEPLVTTPAPDGERNDLPLCAEQAQTRPTARRQPYRRRTGTKAQKVREFLRAHVIRRGPIAVLKLERLAKNDGLLEEGQTHDLDVPHGLEAVHNTIIERFHRAFPTIEDARGVADPADLRDRRAGSIPRRQYD